MAWNEANQNLLSVFGDEVTDEKVKETGALIISLIGDFLSAAEYKVAEESFLIALKTLDRRISGILVFDSTSPNSLRLLGGESSLSVRFDFQATLTKLQKFVTLAITKLEAL